MGWVEIILEFTLALGELLVGKIERSNGQDAPSHDLTVLGLSQPTQDPTRGRDK